MKYINIHKLLLLISIFLIGACSEDLLQEKPQHLITSETLFTSLKGFETGLNGLYAMARMEREGIEGVNYLRAEMFMNGTDNLTTNHLDAGFTGVAEDWVRNIPTHSRMAAIFIWLYQTVNTANTIINQAERRTDVNWSGGQASAEENKNRVLSEAKAIRAWAYRHLTYCYGDVPLNLEESLGSTIKTDWERTPVTVVRNQMKADWLFAEKHLSVEPSVKGKITKGAVQHYLAELFLVLDKPDSAIFWANKCINTPEYQLITNRYGVKSNQPGVPFMDMFLDGNSNREEGNKEALWVWQWEFEMIGGGLNIMRRWHTTRYGDISIGGVRPLQFTIERGGRGQSRMALTKYAIDNYEPQDHRGSNYAIRKYFILGDATRNAPAPADRLPAGYQYGDTIWNDWKKDIDFPTRTRRNWPFSRKWDETEVTNMEQEGQYNDQVYLRLAETYLVKAEAQLMLGATSEAAQTINIIRSRSNASPVSASQINIDFILDERSRELLVEEHRRYALLRTGKWLERVKKYNHNGGQHAGERDLLFPIPQSVIDANLTKTMPQNPGF